MDISVSQLSLLIDEWIFNERDRQILKRRLIDGIKFESLEDEFKLSVRRIKTIVYQGEEQIFKHIDFLKKSY